MGTTINASELPKLVGRKFVGYGELKQSAQIDTNMIYAKFGEGFSVREATFTPTQTLELHD